MKKSSFVFLFICLLLITACSVCPAFAENTITIQAQVDQIKSCGNVVLNMTLDDMKAVGINLGDLIAVSFGEQSIVMPYCTDYSDVESGQPVLVWREDHRDHTLAVSNGDFATTYGFAKITENGWISEEGDTVAVTLSMHMAKGYLEEYTIRSVSYTDERTDYPDLSDAEFANFREITVGNIAPGRLYRSSSPVDNHHQRAPYAAAQFQEANIRVVINLDDSTKEMLAYELYPNSYYSGLNVIALQMGMDPSTPENMSKLAKGLRFALQNDGPICIHCQEGKDRAGYVSAILYNGPRKSDH